jgi:hypothetical protein
VPATAAAPAAAAELDPAAAAVPERAREPRQEEAEVASAHRRTAQQPVSGPEKS